MVWRVEIGVVAGKVWCIRGIVSRSEGLTWRGRDGCFYREVGVSLWVGEGRVRLFFDLDILFVLIVFYFRFLWFF